MTLLKMSFCGAVFIGAVLLLRKAALHRLPKTTFVALWLVALGRLLIPLDLCTPASIYAVVEHARLTRGPTGAPPVVGGLPRSEEAAAPDAPGSALETTAATRGTAAPEPAFEWIAAVWAGGCGALAFFFLLSYGKCRRDFRESVPATHPFIAQWRKGRRLRRPLAIRQSARIASPLTYGVLRPVILLPDTTDWADEKQLTYILEHEFIHIRRFDALTKLLLTAALCVHWFNPLVWVMNAMAARDLELSCDAAVVRRCGGRAAYALTLIGMEESRGAMLPLHFRKNATEERVTAIMKTKKTTLLASAAAICALVGLTTVFATSAPAAAGTGSSTAVRQDAPTDALTEVYSLMTLPSEAEPPSGLTDAQASHWRYEMRWYSPATLDRLKRITPKESAALLRELERPSEAGETSRALSDEEIQRSRALDRAYRSGERYPVGTLPTEPGSFYYDPATFVMHYPDVPLTDEQLLQEVEHINKLNYCIFMQNLLLDDVPELLQTPTAAQALAARDALEAFFDEDLSGLPIDWRSAGEGWTEFTFGILDPLTDAESTRAYTVTISGDGACSSFVLLRDPKPEAAAQDVPMEYADAEALIARGQDLLRGKLGVSDPIAHAVLYTRRSQIMMQLTGESGKAYIIGLRYPALSCEQLWVHDAPFPKERLLGSGKLSYRLLFES